MRKTFILFTLAISAVLFFQCSSSEEKEKEAGETTSSGETASENETGTTTAVCIWEKVSVRETPEEKGKWLTSVNLAEKIELLGEEKTDESGSKKREYCKVKLMDGKEGWMIKDFIVAKSKPGVFVSDVEFYTRPDLLAKSSKSFKRMDIVAVSEVQDDWCKIKGKRSEGTWIDEGWVKTSDISYDEKDLAVSLYGKRALSLPAEKRPEELRKIIDNDDFSGSVFIADLKTEFDALTAIEVSDELIEEEMEDVEDIEVEEASDAVE